MIDDLRGGNCVARSVFCRGGRDLLALASSYLSVTRDGRFD